MRAARILSDPAAVRPSKAIAAAARLVPLVVVTHRALVDLADELGGYEQAARRLLTIATNVGRPLAVNFPTADGSQTLFVAPKGWSEERLAGWAAGHHEALEAAFGPATVRRGEGA